MGWGTQHNSILEYRVAHDSTGRPQTVTTGGGFGARSFTYGYLSNSNQVATLTSGSYQRTTSWQSWRELPDVVNTTWNGSSRGQFTYDHDWMGRRLGEKTTGSLVGVLNSWTAPYGHSNLWLYDSRSQVTQSEPRQLDASGGVTTASPQPDSLRAWTFDPMGNRTQETRGTTTASWSANNLNQVTATGSSGFGNPGYDWSGNLIAQSGWTYTYDGENRLRTAYQTSTGQTYRYSYDYLGRRVRKETFNAAYQLIEDTKFIWVGWQLIAELDGFNLSGAGAGNVKRSYAWGLDALGTLGGAGGTGALLMIREDNAGPRYLPIYDGRQNVRGYLDESGNVVAAFEYSAFGETVASGGSYTTAPIRYASLYHDAATGMYYHHHRFYHPGLGRFINRDPIGIAGGLNLYAYVGNRATNQWDWLGLCPPGEVEVLGECFPKDQVYTVTATRFRGRGEPTERRLPERVSNDGGGGPGPRVPKQVPSDNRPEKMPGEPNPTNPDRWPDDKCRELAAQIAAQQSSLNSFRNTHGGSYVENPGLAAQKGAAEFARLHGGSASEYVSQGVGWAGVASIVAEAGARRFGGSSAIRAVEAGGTILSGVTHPTNLGLAGNDLNHGSGMSAAGNIAGAAGDITALALTGAQAAPVYGWILAGGSAAIFISEQTALGLQRAGSAREIAAHYSNLTNIEAGAVARIDANKRLFETHCSGR